MTISPGLQTITTNGNVSACERHGGDKLSDSSAAIPTRLSAAVPNTASVSAAAAATCLHAPTTAIRSSANSTDLSAKSADLCSPATANVSAAAASAHRDCRTTSLQVCVLEPVCYWKFTCLNRFCGTVYPLPSGAYSWRCRQCGNMNNLRGDDCCVIL